VHEFIDHVLHRTTGSRSFWGSGTVETSRLKLIDRPTMDTNRSTRARATIGGNG
jgi:hypothetical protein